MSEPHYELCIWCGEPTGRAGIADDSLYDNRYNGPYCEKCWEKETDPTPWELGDTSGDATDAAHRQDQARRLK